ncbi:hypothetical protein [Rhodopseudomonas palustris]|uniref:hypothetical protein n=1 Tax=Rhodopseudomonas palustris TaxID=1076 RepID=UPI00131EA7B4|nr:hypothetical protein [Rhodopseudomonas palustris]
MRDIIIELSLFLEIRSTSSGAPRAGCADGLLRQRLVPPTVPIFGCDGVRGPPPHTIKFLCLHRVQRCVPGDSKYVRKRNRQQMVDAQPVAIRAADAGISISAAPQQAAE